MKNKPIITKNKLKLELKIKLLEYLKQEYTIDEKLYNHILNNILIKLEKL